MCYKVSQCFHMSVFTCLAQNSFFLYMCASSSIYLSPLHVKDSEREPRLSGLRINRLQPALCFPSELHSRQQWVHERGGAPWVHPTTRHCSVVRGLLPLATSEQEPHYCTGCCCSFLWVVPWQWVGKLFQLHGSLTASCPLNSAIISVVYNFTFFLYFFIFVGLLLINTSTSFRKLLFF